MLELLVVIMIFGVVATLAVSDFSFFDKVRRRPPKAVFLESMKLARLAAMEQGEEISLYFEEKTYDMVARRTYGGSEVFRKNLYSLSDEEASDGAKGDIEKGAREAAAQNSETSKTDFETEMEKIERQKKREEKLSSLPKIEIVFKPNYPDVYSFTTNDLKGLETLRCLRFAPDSTMTPANIELKIASQSVLKFDADAFSGFSIDKSKIKSKSGE